MDATRRGDQTHPDVRDGNDELAAAPPVLVLLPQDLVGEVPGEQQRVVGHRLDEPLRRDDRDAHARHEAPLLVGAAIDDEIQRLGPDAEGVEQRAPLGGGAVGGDPLALRLEAPEERPQLLP